MRIECPYCGERGLDEFVYHGDATVSRPEEMVSTGPLPLAGTARVGGIPTANVLESPPPSLPREWGGTLSREEVFGEYVYTRSNPAGPHRELWYHAMGCHAWLVVERDTRSHAILSVEPARDVALKRIAR